MILAKFGAAPLAVALIIFNGAALAHGFAGARFFPATLITDDPFVADEWSFPTVSWFRDTDGVATSTASLDFAKRITANLGVEFAETYIRQRPQGGPSTDGFDNLSAGLKYQLLVDAPHETIFAIGVDADIGGTGAKHIGADDFTTVTPAFFFGKGFGDLSQPMDLLRPLAITGSAGVGIPAVARMPGGPADALRIGFALEYSLIYLQTQVRDFGLRAPFDRMIPLVEVSLEKSLDYASQRITGTIAPGVLWAGQYVQIGAEALVPINGASGRGVGFIAQLHLYIDDLFPQTFGRPLLGA